MVDVNWPHMREEDRWLTGAFEDLLGDGSESADQMRTRARELREEAEREEIRGIRAAKLALADCYEQTAASRLAA